MRGLTVFRQVLSIDIEDEAEKFTLLALFLCLHRLATDDLDSFGIETMVLGLSKNLIDIQIDLFPLLDQPINGGDAFFTARLLNIVEYVARSFQSGTNRSTKTTSMLIIYPQKRRERSSVICALRSPKSTDLLGEVEFAISERIQ